MQAAENGVIFHRLIEVMLPKGGIVIFMHEGYFDESGDLETEPEVFTISGYFMPSDEARKMDAAWKAALDKLGVEVFHAKECIPVPKSGCFKDIPDDDCDALVRELIAIIKKYTTAGFSVVCHGAHMNQVAEYDSAYDYCAHLCASRVRYFLHYLNIPDDESLYFFESGG